MDADDRVRVEGLRPNASKRSPSEDLHPRLVDGGTMLYREIPLEGRGGYRRPMELRILGPVEVSAGNGLIPLGGPKQRAVLAHLLLRANQLIPTEVLIDQVWGEEPPEAARNTLQGYASHLRKALGPGRLEGSRAGYVLQADPSEVDAHRFRSLVHDARRLAPIEPKAAVVAFDEALALWRGPAFADLAEERSLLAEAARLDELQLDAMEDRAEAMLTLGRHADLIGDLERLTTDHPLRERAWGQLMLALYRTSRQAEALAAFDRARRILADELGIDPSPELRRLHERVLQQSPDLDVGGAPLRGYRLLERVGVGGYGTVWRAIQPEVGRDVAIKAIHPHLANDPAFVRRFEAEAQLVARLEHPHIVPLYDYWREPGGAYLVMRFLRGGSLADALGEGPLDIDRLARLVDQVGDALALAHRQGVIHRDVKPGNILLDQEGNVYLADFGIAKNLGATERTAPGSAAGSLLYAAPEQIRGQDVTPRTDLYAFGIVVHEALAGRHPFADAPDIALLERQLREPLPRIGDLRTELPPAVDEVLARATAKDPGARFEDAGSMAAAIHDVLAPSTAVAPPAPANARNPFKGLRPFAEADSNDFFGREAFVERLLARMRKQGRFLAVVGASGSGKSSAVRAGLVPALRRGALPGSDGWFVTEMLPGRHPIEELEAALLRVATQPPAGLALMLGSGPRGLLEAVDRLIPNEAELVLVVDQLEEAFTLTEDEVERALLLESLRVAAADPASRIRIVATLRGDFYDRPLNYPRFGELLGTSTEVVTPLAPDELERAMTKPAGAVGARVEPALVAQVVADVADQPGALPLVQYALTELFDHREDGRLTVSAYHDIGGVGGALASRAENLYGTRRGHGRDAVRQMFLRLVTLGESAADTRRRVPVSELTAIEVDAEAMQDALDAFGRARLLTFDRDPATREPTVEVAHEALLRSWPRLRGWIDAAREDVRSLRRLEEAALEWEWSGREPSFLLRGSRLERLESWSEHTDLAIGRVERGYLRASVAEREEERVAEATRAERERALDRRSNRRLRALVAALTAGILVAGTLVVIASNRNATAQRATRLAFARELATAASANLDVDRELAVLLALKSLQLSEGRALPQAEETLRRAGAAVTIDTRSVLGGGVHDADISSDGNAVAVVGGEGSVGVWDLLKGQRTFVDPSPERCAKAVCPQVRGVSISDDGAWLAARTYPVRRRGPNAFHVWDLAPDRETLSVRPTPAGSRIAPSNLMAEGSVTISPDGELLATGEWGKLQMLSVGSGRPIWALDLGGGTPRLTFSPDAKQVFVYRTESNVGSFGLQLVDVRTGEANVLFPADIARGEPGFSADGTRLVFQHASVGAAGAPTEITVWDVVADHEIVSAPSPLGAYALSPDGTLVAVASAVGGSVELQAADTLGLIRTLLGGGREVTEIAFDRVGSRIAAANSDGTVEVWDARAGDLLLTTPAEPTAVSEISFNQDGSLLIVVYEDGRIFVYPIALEDAIGIAKARVTRALTDEECLMYLHVPSCPAE